MEPTLGLTAIKAPTHTQNCRQAFSAAHIAAPQTPTILREAEGDPEVVTGAALDAASPWQGPQIYPLLSNAWPSKLCIHVSLMFNFTYAWKNAPGNTLLVITVTLEFSHVIVHDQ